MTQTGAEAPADPHARRRMRVGLLQCVIVGGALALIALTWGFTLISVETERNEASAHIASDATNIAKTLQWELNRQLQAIDQTMQILAAGWRNDPVHFDPGIWKQRSSLLGDVSSQLSIVDANGLVVASSRPDLVGANMSASDYFAAQRASGHAGLFVGPAIRWRGDGHWEIDLSRRLERADGSFAGVIVVAFDPWVLTAMLEQVDLGPRGLIALLGADGAIRAIVSPYQITPGEDVSASEMFARASRRQDDVWVGPSAPDGVERVHAFRRLGGQDLTIVVGIDRAEAMRSALAWGANARFFADGITVMLAIMAIVLMREVRAAGGREARLANDRAILAAAYAGLEAAKARADGKTSQLQAILSGMSDGVMMLDEHLRLVQWNERFPQYAGVPREILRVGMRYAELLRAQAAAGEFGPGDAEAEIAQRLAELRGPRATGVSEHSRPNGRTLELRRGALPGGGFVTLYTDITARKQTEEAHALARRLAEEATEQKSRFVAMVSHEIRTPLNAVVNSLTLLDHSGLSSSQHRFADTARQAGDALLDLVNDILELSKMDAGQLSVRPTVFTLATVLEGVQDMFRPQAENRGIRLVLDIAADMPERIRADCGRLRQVLMNFVSNATKFSLPGDVTIRAASVAGSRGPALLLSVCDQGPRIPDREAALLFQPFSRLDNARTSGAQGTGLGLAICEHLTRLMDGTIGVGPAATGGNEFWINLPLEAVATPVLPALLQGAPDRRWRRASLLLVEDIPANHLVTATMLRREGHRVDVAESGADALRLARQQPYDLIFMDLFVPGMNGYEAARRIRALDGPAALVPIVALTANTAPQDRARCLEAGMIDMLVKPVRQAELIDVLTRAIQHGARDASAPTPPAPTGRSEAPAVDLERFADLRRGLASGTLESLVKQCLADMRKRLPSLRRTLDAGEPSAIEEAAHALAGMAGTYGLASLERRMRRVTSATRRNDLADAWIGAEGVEAELDRASEAMRELLRDRAA